MDGSSNSRLIQRRFDGDTGLAQADLHLSLRVKCLYRLGNGAYTMTAAHTTDFPLSFHGFTLCDGQDYDKQRSYRENR